MFYPPKGRLLADSSRGPIVFTYVLFCVRKRILGFQFRGGFLPKKILENVLFGGWDGWDGMGWDGMGWMGWGIKSVLQYSSYFVGI